MSDAKRRLLPVLCLLLVALACNEHGLIPVDEAILAEQQDTFTQLATNQIDILWVIDNSNSMCEEQIALTSNFDAFIDGLAGINADFRIAVVTTDMERDNGRFRTAPGVITQGCGDVTPPSCPATTGPVLSATDYGFNPNIPGSPLDVDALRQDFRCIASVGTDGSGFEKGLDAMQTALSDDLLQSVNIGFRRQEAWLAIIFVADENDCSENNTIPFTNGRECEWLRADLTPPQNFIDFLNSYPGTESGARVLVAGIIGPDDGVRPLPPDDPRQSCNSALGTAFAGYRYEEVITAFAERGAQSNICVDGFDDALDQIAGVIRANLATKCLREVPRTCATSADCETGLCELRDPDGQGLAVCSDFDVVVERRNTENNWFALDGASADPQYIVNYDANNCPTGLGIEFTPGNEPGAGSEFRIRYPIVLNTSSEPVDRGTPDAAQ